MWVPYCLVEEPKEEERAKAKEVARVAARLDRRLDYHQSGSKDVGLRR